MDPITSFQNPRVKAAAKLRDRRERDRRGRILIDGAREIRRALRHGARIVEFFACPALCRSPDARAALDELAAAGISAITTTEPVFSKLAYGERSEGVVAVAEPPRRALAELRLPTAALVAVVDGVEKPGNLGAVIRSADGAGLAALVAADARADFYNPNCIRASLGAVFALPVAAAPAEEVKHWLAAAGLAIVAARVDGGIDYTTIDFTRPTAIVLGSEAAGLGDLWTGAGVTAARLQMRGAVDSLNVSATAAVIFYEALRQRTPLG